MDGDQWEGDMRGPQRGEEDDRKEGDGERYIVTAPLKEERTRGGQRGKMREEEGKVQGEKEAGEGRQSE